jgi:hypothetical protein
MVIAVFLLPVGLFQCAKADLADKVHKTSALILFWLAGADLNGFQSVGDDILHIRLPDLPHSFNGKRVLLVAIGQHVPHQVFENILFD